MVSVTAALLVIVRRCLMVIVIRDSDRPRVRVHVNHLDTEVYLQVAALSVYPDLFVPAGICSLAVFLHLDKSNTVLVHDNEIDRGCVLARRKDPVPQAHKMFGTDQLAKVTVYVALVTRIAQNGSSRQCGRRACLPGQPAALREPSPWRFRKYNIRCYLTPRSHLLSKLLLVCQVLSAAASLQRATKGSRFIENSVSSR